MERLVVSLTTVKYPSSLYILPALFGMVLHRIPLFFNKQISFWKLLGCGKGGGFRKRPDWQHWGILTVRSGGGSKETSCKQLYGGFIAGWYRFWNCSTRTLLLEPVEGHGTWDGKAVFGVLNKQHLFPEERIAVLTRATIRLNKLKRFWQHVKPLNDQMNKTEGLIASQSIGELPFVRQGTFSIWENTMFMKTFAYSLQEHKEVIKKTREENWYREEMFVRFRILGIFEETNGKIITR